jgi:hypothetical protein
LDGTIDEEIWGHAPWTDDFEDIEGDLKPRPRFRTRVRMMWDDDCLYIGAEMREPHVWGTLTEHDCVIGLFSHGERLDRLAGGITVSDAMGNLTVPE